MIRPRYLFLLSLLAAAAGQAKDFSLRSQDGLALFFNSSGQIASVREDGKNLTAAHSPGGFSLSEVGSKKRFTPVTGTLTTSNATAQFYGHLASGFEVEAEFKSEGDYIAVEGKVRNLTKEDRCVDLEFSLPINCAGWQWGTDLAGEDTIPSGMGGLKTADGVTVYPIAPISRAAPSAGVSLAVPPTWPTLFDTGADTNGLFIVFKIGLSSATVPPQETGFRLIIYRHDPQWGFRSSLQRYYDFFREPFFIRRVKRIGAWCMYQRGPAELKNPQLFAFHEAGSEGAVMGGRHEGASPAKTVAEFEKLCDFATDEKLGIYSLPYTIVGQRQIYNLPQMPKNRAEALEDFEHWTTDEPILFQSNGPANGFRTVNQLKEIIRNSGIYDETQQPTVLIREYTGNTVSFPLNPNPKLFADSDKMTIAKYTLDDYLPMLFNGSKLIDGCYLDSLGNWLTYYNYRRDHFKDTTVPLTYHGHPAQPCLWNAQSHAEYLWELARRSHDQGKIVFANGVHADRVMLGFAVDAMGMEGRPSYENRAAFFATRVAAGNKPYCALNAGDTISSVVWNSCLYLGILIGSHSEKSASLEQRFLPTIVRLNEAGWQPIPLARMDSPEIGLERWGGGDGKPFFFTLLNRSKQEKTVSVAAASSSLKVPPKPRVFDLINNKVISATNALGKLQFAITLGKGKAAALQIGE